MTKFHVNDNGDPGPCHAKIKCRFGSLENDHYDSPEEARKAFEQKNSINLFSKIKKNKRLKNFTAVGGAFIATISISACGSNITQAPSTEEPSTTQSVEQQVSSAAVDTKDKIGSAIKKLDQERNRAGYTNDKLKEEGAKAWSQATAGAKKGVSELDKKLNTPNDYGTPSSPDGVHFQGKSLEVSPAEVVQAKETLSKIRVAPEENVDGKYNRAEQFGRAFQTGVVGRLEHRDITNGVFKNAAPQSRAIGGNFIDPYTGEPVQIVKGSTTDTDVDHVVPLKEAAESGALDEGFTQTARESLANDMDNLEITSSSANRYKSDKDVAEYVPSYKPAQKRYVIASITIKAKYNLSVDPAEKQAMENYLNN